MKLFIGIDDTDNLESRGTGHLARRLGLELEAAGLISLHSISRHQLLVDPRIPYTSHNSSASLECTALKSRDEIAAYCRNFLATQSAPGSDAGLCIVPAAEVDGRLLTWGLTAKEQVLSEGAAYKLASEANVLLEGITGRKTGVIGSLAAVGLKAWGNDGRLLWLRGLREHKGEATAADMKKAITGIDLVCTREHEEIPETDMVDAGEWCRPVNLNGKVVLIVDNDSYGKWKTADKEYIKSITE